MRIILYILWPIFGFIVGNCITIFIFSELLVDQIVSSIITLIAYKKKENEYRKSKQTEKSK